MQRAQRMVKNDRTRLSARRTCVLTVVMLAMIGTIGACTAADSRSGNSTAINDTTPPALLTDSQLTRMHRIPIDTIPVHVDPPDAIIRGPASRIVVMDSASLPVAWALAGAHGVPPAVDFHHDAVVLIGTAVHGGTWNVSADSVFALNNRLYVIVHEHTTCAPVDVFGRGTIALRISRALAWHVTFVERPFDSCGGQEAS